MDERQQAQAEVRAELSFGQALWYAWGRLDSGEYRGRKFKNPLDAFEFASRVRKATREFELEETHVNESIQGQWDKYVASETP